MTPLLLIADVSGTGSPSDVAAGAWLTLVLPLVLLAIVLTWWWFAARRGWPKLPGARRQVRAPHAPAPQREPPRQDGEA